MQNLKNLFDYGQFEVVDGKCTFVYNYGANNHTQGKVRFTGQYDDLVDLANDDDYYYIYAYDILLFIAPDLPDRTMSRLSTMFGMI